MTKSNHGEDKREYDEKPRMEDHGLLALIPVDREHDFTNKNCHWGDCLKEYDMQEDLVKHIDQAHTKAIREPFVCQWSNCSSAKKPYRSRFMLILHLRKHTGEKPYKCAFQDCTKTFAYVSNRARHLRSHTGGMPYMLEIPGFGRFNDKNCRWGNCLKEYDMQEDLVKHINQAHIKAINESFVCQWSNCSRAQKPCGDRYLLTKHVRKHTGEKPYKCTFQDCTRTFADVSNRAKHFRSHTGGMPYMLEIPGFSRFNDKNCRLGNCLKEYDMQEDLVKSQDCTRTFAEVNNAAKHLRSHTGDMPYICEIPGYFKAFSRFVDRANHHNIDHLNAISRFNNQNRPCNKQLKNLRNNKGNDSFNTNILHRHDYNTKTFSNRLCSDNSIYPFGSLSSSDESSKMLTNHLNNAYSPYFSGFCSDRNSFGSHPYSCHSSKMLTNRLNITNSLYECSFTGNQPMNHSHRCCGSYTSDSIRNMEAYQGNQSGQRGPSNTLQNPASKYQPDFIVALQDMDSDSITSIPCQTPLPNEIPNRDTQITNDPVRVVDTNLRFHNLNTMEQLFVPNRNMWNKFESNNALHSSQSCIATDGDSADGVINSQIKDTDTKTVLEEKNLGIEGFIVPDKMRLFSNNRYGNDHSKFSFDPSPLPESDIFYLPIQQGAYMNGANIQISSGNFTQNAHDGSNMGNNMQGIPIQNCYDSSSQNMNCSQGMNFYNQSMDNMQIHSLGESVKNTNMPIDSLQSLLQENTAAWTQGQITEQFQNICPPVHTSMG